MRTVGKDCLTATDNYDVDDDNKNELPMAKRQRGPTLRVSLVSSLRRLDKI